MDVRTFGGIRTFGTFASFFLIDMRRSLVSEADISDLLSAMKEIAWRSYDGGIIFNGEADYALGLAIFLEGDREKGVELIGKAMDFRKLVPRNRAYLQSLFDDPGFKLLLEAYEVKLASEGKRFLTVVCTDNPYQEFWQSEPGTCEEFLAKGAN